MASAQKIPRRLRAQIDPFLPEFTWEEVQPVLEHLATSEPKQAMISQLVAELRDSPHPTISELLTSIFKLAIWAADEDVRFSEHNKGFGEAPMP